MKYTEDGTKNRLDIVEEKIGELDIAVETTQNKTEILKI